MGRLVDDMAKLIEGLFDLRFIASRLLKRYDAMKEQEMEEVILTREDLTDEAFDYIALDPEYERTFSDEDPFGCLRPHLPSWDDVTFSCR